MRIEVGSRRLKFLDFGLLFFLRLIDDDKGPSLG